MDIFSDIVSSKHFLDKQSLLSKIFHILSIIILGKFELELLPSMKCSEQSLNFNGCFLFFEELFPLDIHFKLRLYLKGSLVIPHPIFLSLISVEEVELFHSGKTFFGLLKELHFVIYINKNKLQNCLSKFD